MVSLENIKDYREKELKNYVIANLLILVIFTDTLNFLFEPNDDLTNSIIKTISFSFISSIIYIFVFILDGLISSSAKDRWIFMEKYKLPGFTVFTDIKNGKLNDIRFSNSGILEFHEEIYNDMESFAPKSIELKRFENEKWYGLYMDNRESNMIIFSQRDYLLTRDMYVSTISIAVLYVLFSKMVDVIAFNKYVLLYFVVMTIVTNLVTRVKVKRYVLNVIALSVYIKDKGDK